MKLISCFIAGFGKFSSQSFEFSPSLTVIKEDNGWGKTTLADFIKCMLFGMDNGRNRAIDCNDRMKYEPWKGGAYGGYLLFSCNQKTYRVERSFGKTAGMDSVRVYDSNNMLCYDFGEKAERLGELLFGVDAESYEKSVYIPQGEIKTGALPDDMKGRLLSLLSTGGQGENSASRAIEKLDEADRALRSRRRPLKGKLDEIDEKLELLYRQQREKAQNMENARALRMQAAQAEREISDCGKRLETLNKALEETALKKEREARMETARGIKEELERLKKTLDSLSVFFKGVDPLTVNTDGLTNAVTEFYALKEKCEKTEKTLSELSPVIQEKAALFSQLQTLKNTLDSYEKLLNESGGRTGAGTRRKRGKKIIPPKRKSNAWILAAGLLLSCIGAILSSETLVGFALLGVGLVGMLFVFIRTLPRYEKVEGEEEERSEKQANEEIVQEYSRLGAEFNAVRDKLRAYPADAESRKERLSVEREGMKNRMAGLEKGIRNFLSNFAFAETYDYRSCVMILKEKTEEYKRCKEGYTEREKRLSEFSFEERSEEGQIYSVADVTLLKKEKGELEERKEKLLSYRAQLLSEAENSEKRISGDLASEEETLLEEKNRLERRRKAILAAKEILLKAKENMASRYLEPVENSCRHYLAQFDVKEGNVCFTAEGTPLCEEQGKRREIDYYSAGIKELIGLCTRVALIDAIYTKEPPVLIMDDPLCNLDDHKTAKAKAWIKSLSARYQIVYLTCKNDRKI